MADGDGATTDDTTTGVQFEQLDVTEEDLVAGLQLWDTPLTPFAGHFTQAIGDRLRTGPHLRLPASVFVTEILLSVDPPILGFDPGQRVWSKVTITGFGWEPGAPVALKWNNALDFPDNGAGAHSIRLPDAIPDPHGFFKVQTVRQTVKRPSKQWYWEANNQLVMVAQQHVGTPNKVEADQRGIPPHVLWQWVP